MHKIFKYFQRLTFTCAWILLGIFLVAVNIFHWKIIFLDGWANLAARGKHMVFVSVTSSLDNVTTREEMKFYSSDGFFAFFGVVATLADALVSVVTLGVIPCVIFTAWLVARNFSEFVALAMNTDKEGIVRQVETSRWSEIYTRYQTIRDLFDMMNSTFGPAMTLFTAAIVVNFAMALDAILVSTDIYAQLRNVLCQIVCGIVLITAADVANQVKQFLKMKT